MSALSELILLAVSFGALSSWENGDGGRGLRGTSPSDARGTLESKVESKSLYDLMAHFPVDKGIACPEKDARFRHPGQCSRYVTCRNYRAHVRSCPPGMNFDEGYGHCRLAFEVDCEEPSAYRFECRPDEKYSDCKCEMTCDNLYIANACENECNEGCFCRAGYVRDRDGRCVMPEDCENSLFSVFLEK